MKLLTSLRTLFALGVVQAALLCLQPANHSQAAVMLLNGNFESIGATYNAGFGGIYEAQSWVNLTPGLPINAAIFTGSSTSGNPEFPASLDGKVTGLRYLRLVSDQANPLYFGAIAQVVGTMTAGETYTLKGDIFGTNGANIDYSATIQFANQAVLNPSKIYASQAIANLTPGTFLDDGINLSYTATALDQGQPLAVYMFSPQPPTNSQATRGGIDDLRLTTVPEPASALLVGGAVAGLACRRRRRA